MAYFKSLQPVEKKQANLAFARAYGTKGQPYDANWNLERAVSVGLQTCVWSFRAVDAIAKNQAGLPFIIRQGDMWSGEPLKNHPLLDLMNYRPNKFQDAWSFRYTLSQQILINKLGCFIEVIRNRRGEPIELYMLPPGRTKPIPDPDNFVSGYRVYSQQGLSAYQDVDPDNVIWIKLPHPTDPYSGLTPLEAAGLSIESDILAAMFNRNFLQNDGRPGGILAIKDEIATDEDAEEIRGRFLGPAIANGVAGAGRLTVLETGENGIDYVDTSGTPREGQYIEMKGLIKNEILVAFGTPEGMLGNASGRTFDNASTESEGFWRETEIPHVNLIARPLDRETGDRQYAGFDTSSIYVLDRDKREQYKYFLDELRYGAISPDEYLEKTGQKPIGDSHHYRLNTMIPYNEDGKPDMEAVPAAILAERQPALPSPRGGAQPPVEDPTQAPPATSQDRTPDMSNPAKKDFWVDHIERALKAYMARQERVVLKRAADNRVNKENLLDQERWNKELMEDAEIWLNAIYADYGADLTDEKIQNLISEQAKTWDSWNAALSLMVAHSKDIKASYEELDVKETAIKEVEAVIQNLETP